jgi:hypothetical protein
MKSPDGRRECSTFLRHKKIALSGKKTTMLYLLNPSERQVERIEVDGCAITEGKRCDWLVRLNDATSNEEIYVELKASHVHHAVEQLRATMENLSADRAKFPKRCFIVFNRNPMIGTDVQKYKAQFRQTFRSGLDLVKSNKEVPL